MMQYWIISARTVVRKVLRKGVVFLRDQNLFSLQLMGDHPVSRVNPGRAFSKSGVRVVKTYACIFVCFITKAVHLELVGYLSANSYVAVLKRFIARRGRPEELYSDCGTNFIGSSRELRKWASNEARLSAGNMLGNRWSCFGGADIKSD
ncbi:uncharacterized protein TNCT_243381 [Trichonephila clavata]|uniref:Integrase catalytic domain-containing protein n=1 Tax=Trichonephila clavata TaxID=2740835 RepID=A0A8X6M4B0_TRICU|nr:uncharacterized protein TNCT_243381 [Trichonephila clavata]